MPTGGNGSLRLAISAEASSPVSSSVYLRVRPGVDTGRRAAQAGCGVTPTALDKGTRSPPSSYAPSSHGLLGRKASLRLIPSPLGSIQSAAFPMPWRSRGRRLVQGRSVGIGSRSCQSPDSGPSIQEQPKRREARRGAEGGGALPHRLPPAPQPGRRPQAPSLSRLTGILRSASYSRNRPFGRGSTGVPDDLGCRPSAVLAGSAVEPVSGT